MSEGFAVQTLIEHAAQFLEAAFGNSAKTAASTPRDSLLQATALIECAQLLSGHACTAQQKHGEKDQTSGLSASLDICIKLLRLPQILCAPGVLSTAEGKQPADAPGDAVSNSEPCQSEGANTSDDASLQDIVGNEQAKRMLLDNVVLPLKAGPAFRKQVLSGIRAGGGNVLLYGPPGNGKTKLARAAANEANAKFFAVNPSNVLSKYQGESERHIRQLFALAKKAAQSVIFFDELDSIGCARGSAGDDVQHRRLLAELLIQFNSISADHKLVVLAATNRIEDVDEALLRRFQARIFVGPPTYASRVSLLKAFMATVQHDLCTKHFGMIADATDGWSGADIEALCREAALGPVRALFAGNTSSCTPATSSTESQQAPHMVNNDKQTKKLEAGIDKAIHSGKLASEAKRSVAEVSPPRESNTPTWKRSRVDGTHLGKDFEGQGAIGELRQPSSDVVESGAAMAACLLEDVLDGDVARHWHVPSVTYRDFEAAYAVILSVDVVPQELADLIEVSSA